MALKHISLRDFVIVRELELDLSAGFSVLTGETGAGKSILIDAVQLALGARADASVVREGAARAEISLEMHCPDWLVGWLEDAGFTADTDSLLIRRTIDAQGKSRAWINGSPATVGQLKEASEKLVDIHGQHAWAALTRADAVRGLLDAFGNIPTLPVTQAWQSWRSALARLQDARSQASGLHTERERLQWQIGEMDKLAPAKDEWSELNAEHGTLSNANSLLEGAQQALERLEGHGEGASDAEPGAIVQLTKALQTLQNQELLTQDFKGLSEILTQSLAQAEDAAHSLHAYLRKTEPNPQRLAQLDERMGLWMSMARRYKRPPADLYALQSGWKESLLQLEQTGDLDALEKTESSAHAAFNDACAILSKARKKTAPKLSAAITQAMQGLGMHGGHFEVALQTLDEAAAYGAERVEFLVAGHAGNTPRQIGKVASGGELSRIALAIAVCTSELGQAGTLIFDEVDSGVGGAVAETVGRLMKQLGKDRQVLAVTHLPQVASCADHHLQVSKKLDGKQTVSHVHAITGEQRVAEIARMLGGEKLSGTTLAHAKEMLGQ